MYKIRITGEAKTDTADLGACDGIDCQDCFTDYIDDNFDGAISGGYMHFEIIDGVLTTVTEYESTRELTKTEVKELEEYTQGQWSDGIGEGFEQQECGYDKNDDDIFISPWFHGQVLATEQIKL